MQVSESSARVVHEDDVAVESWSDRPESVLSWKTLVGRPEGGTDSLTCGVATFAPGGQLEPHRHAQSEVYYVTEGSGRVWVADAPFEVRAGSCVFIPGNTLHRVENTGDCDLRLFYTFATPAFTDVHYVYE
jgi:mannose-6-phosphate isomerase-like protein (cupin superfamily)